MDRLPIGAQVTAIPESDSYRERQNDHETLQRKHVHGRGRIGSVGKNRAT